MPTAAEAGVYNQDVVSLVSLMNRFTQEMCEAQSANGADVLPHDKERWTKYIGSINTLRAWIVSQPVLDLPESHPTQIALPPIYVPQIVENEAVNTLARMMDKARYEIANCASARLGSGLNKHDADRNAAYMTKMASFITDYIEKVEPLDLPETTPKMASIPQGKLGV